jgi:hypothetical protein
MQKRNAYIYKKKQKIYYLDLAIILLLKTESVMI